MAGLESQLVGLNVTGVASLAVGYAGSVPLEGEWFIRDLVLMTPIVADPAISHTFAFGARSEVPASGADMLAAEQLFPMLGISGSGGRYLRISAAAAVVHLRGRFRFNFGGRRLVMGFGNGAGVGADGSALFVIERVEKGAAQKV